MKIGKRTRAKAVELIAGLMEGYHQQIEDAYCKTDEHLDVTLKVRFAAAGDQGVKITAKISFIESKISDEIAEVIDEEQMPLEL